MSESTEFDCVKETIDWDEDYLKSIQGQTPGAKYGPISEKLRHSIPEAKVCSLFCGGKKCKYDNPEPWKEEQQAIKGLYSSWITDNILATARPNTEGIKKYDIIEQFKKNGIASIINCQTYGEHASCGTPLEELGFSYHPQDFMDNGVFFYNFGWPDYSVGSLGNILDMVKVMQFALSEGKVAIHCHAGLGRTGVLIACYLVFANRMGPDEAVHYIRSKRPGSIQTRSQILCIQEFGNYLEPLRIIYSSLDDKVPDFTLTQHLARQKLMLHGFEARALKHIPKIVHVICETLLEISYRGHIKTMRKDSFKNVKESAPSAFNNQGSYTKKDAKLHEAASSPAILESKGEPQMSKSKRNKHQGSKKQAGLRGLDYSESNLCFTSTTSSELDINWYSMCAEKDQKAEAIAEALSQGEYSQEIKGKCCQIKKTLNEDSLAWKSVQEESDPYVLACLLWDWIDHLKEPLLTALDMITIRDFIESEQEFEKISQLSKGTKKTVLYLMVFLAKLMPIDLDIEQQLFQKFMSVLCHQNVDLDDPVLNQGKTQIRKTSNEGDMTLRGASRLVHYFGWNIKKIWKKNIEHRKHNGEEYQNGSGERNRMSKKSYKTVQEEEDEEEEEEEEDDSGSGEYDHEK